MIPGVAQPVRCDCPRGYLLCECSLTCDFRNAPLSRAVRPGSRTLVSLAGAERYHVRSMYCSILPGPSSSACERRVHAAKGLVFRAGAKNRRLSVPDHCMHFLDRVATVGATGVTPLPGSGPPPRPGRGCGTVWSGTRLPPVRSSWRATRPRCTRSPPGPATRS